MRVRVPSCNSYCFFQYSSSLGPAKIGNLGLVLPLSGLLTATHTTTVREGNMGWWHGRQPNPGSAHRRCNQSGDRSFSLPRQASSRTSGAVPDNKSEKKHSPHGAGTSLMSSTTSRCHKRLSALRVFKLLNVICFQRGGERRDGLGVCSFVNLCLKCRIGRVVSTFQ